MITSATPGTLIGRLANLDQYRVVYGTTFFTQGTASGTQCHVAINNPAASGRVVIVHHLVGHLYETSNCLGRQFNTLKSAALATGGTAITKVKRRTSETAAGVIVLGATASDGGGATAITPGGSAVRISSTVSPSGFQAFTALNAGATQNWDLIDPRVPVPELEAGESIHVIGDNAASGFLAISFVLSDCPA